MKSTLQFWKSATKSRKPMGTMGIGKLSDKYKCPECDNEFCSNIIFKRKFRWTIEAELPGGKVEQTFVKLNARPAIEETELNFLGNKAWIPGKQHWEQISVTFYEQDNKKGFWTAIVPSTHEITEGTECPPEKLGKFKLCLYDGCGGLIESWSLEDAYISRMRFNELDHSSSECIDVELDIRCKKTVYNNELGFGTYNVTCPNCKHKFKNTSNTMY